MNKERNKILYSKTIKMALSATIATFIADYFGLSFGVTAGVIAILSILNTKKEAFKVGAKRLVACSIALGFSFGIYLLLGNSPLIFGLFLLIFIPITLRLKLDEGMVVGVVLSTHLLTSGNIDLNWIANELALVTIGVGVALLFNLYTPSLEEEFIKNKEEIEALYRNIISEMASKLLMNFQFVKKESDIEKVERILHETKDIAYRISNNSLFKSNNYYIEYINMRTMQLDTIKRMNKHLLRVNMKYEQTVLLSQFTLSVGVNIHEDNDCIYIIEELNKLRKGYTAMELPTSRQEFENRAMLFQFLNDLEDFLVIKREFKKVDN